MGGTYLQRWASVSGHGTPRASGLGVSIPDLCSTGRLIGVPSAAKERKMSCGR